MLDRKGFTLIELLIVVVIIGILAAIAIPKFANTKEKAYVAAMKSDLRNLVTAEEAYFADKNLYADVANMTGAPYLYATSSGVGGLAITPAGGLGWTAQVTHTGSPQACGIAVGVDAAGNPQVNPIDATANEGEPKCK